MIVKPAAHAPVLVLHRCQLPGAILHHVGKAGHPQALGPQVQAAVHPILAVPLGAALVRPLVLLSAFQHRRVDLHLAASIHQPEAALAVFQLVEHGDGQVVGSVVWSSGRIVR
jgi:hypothetical protein